MDKTRWWWVRHGPIEAAHAGRINGQRDVGVDLTDLEQLARLKTALPDGAQWVTSALSRTQATARALGADTFDEDADLNEQNFGDWQGESWTALADRADAKTFWAAPATTAPPGGESFSDQIARVGPAMDRLSRAHVGRDIIAVVHAGTIRAALAHALRVGAAPALGFEIATLSLSRMDHFAVPSPGSRAGNWRISAVNRTFAAGA